MRLPFLAAVLVVTTLLGGCLGGGAPGSPAGAQGPEATPFTPDASSTLDPSSGPASGADGPGSAPDGTDADGNGTGEGTGQGTAPGNGTDTGNGTASENGTTASPSPSPSPSPSGGPEPGTRLLEVSVWDLTTAAVYYPQDLAVIVTDHGPWQPELPPGGVAGPEPMGRHDVGVLKPDGLTVRFGGAYAAVCKVDLMVTEEMQEYAPEDITQVEVYNTDVRIFGSAVPGHPDYDNAYVCPR